MIYWEQEMVCTELAGISDHPVGTCSMEAHPDDCEASQRGHDSEDDGWARIIQNSRSSDDPFPVGLVDGAIWRSRMESLETLLNPGCSARLALENLAARCDISLVGA